MSDYDGADQTPKEILLARHRLEKKQLQGKIMQMKKSAGTDKKKKKTLMQEISNLEQELQVRHESELKELHEKGEKDLETQVENLSLDDDSTQNDDNEEASTTKRISKAEKRRQKKAQAQRERDELIEESRKNNKFSSRNIEMASIKKILKERNMIVHDIKSDGDCLFAAIAHQLSDGKTVGELRSLASNFIREHKDDFLPFLTDPNTGDLLTPDHLNHYCDKIESTSMWGGQPELRALSQGLEKRIEVLQAIGDPIIFGEEFSSPPILLTYYRHLYELGEHYNSVIKPSAEES